MNIKTAELAESILTAASSHLSNKLIIEMSDTELEILRILELSGHMRKASLLKSRLTIAVEV